jgi:hypothetical protein
MLALSKMRLAKPLKIQSEDVGMFECSSKITPKLRPYPLVGKC